MIQQGEHDPNRSGMLEGVIERGLNADKGRETPEPAPVGVLPSAALLCAEARLGREQQNSLGWKWEVSMSIPSPAAGIPKLGGHSPGVSQGPSSSPGTQLLLLRATHTDKGLSFLISFIATAPGKWEVTAEGSSWQQPGGVGRTDVRGKITGAKSVGFDSAAAPRLSVCQEPGAYTDVTPHSRDRQMF